MACFIAPAAEAVVTTVITKRLEKKEQAAEAASGTENRETKKLRFSDKLKWLNRMLWGGSALLAFEHLWHGEIVPWFPFLTRAADASDRAEMLTEIATNGIAMSLLITLVWGVMAVVSGRLEKAPAPEEAEEEALS